MFDDRADDNAIRLLIAPDSIHPKVPKVSEIMKRELYEVTEGDNIAFWDAQPCRTLPLL